METPWFPVFLRKKLRFFTFFLGFLRFFTVGTFTGCTFTVCIRAFTGSLRGFMGFYSYLSWGLQNPTKKHRQALWELKSLQIMLEVRGRPHCCTKNQISYQETEVNVLYVLCWKYGGSSISPQKLPGLPVDGCRQPNFVLRRDLQRAGPPHIFDDITQLGFFPLVFVIQSL